MSTEEKNNTVETEQGTTTGNQTVNNGNSKQKKIGKIFGIILILLIVVIFIVIFIYYKKIEKKYQEVFFSNSSINGVSCGELSGEKIESIILSSYDDYALVVKDINDAPLSIISADQVGFHVALATNPNDIIKKQNSSKWYEEQKRQHEYQIDKVYTYDEKILEQFFDSWDVLDPKKMIQPVDAYIGEYDEEAKAYVIHADDPGTVVDVEAVKEAVKTALLNGYSEVSISECYVGAKIKADNKNLVARLDRLNAFLKARIEYDWNGAEFVVDADMIHEWIDLTKNGFHLNADRVTEFVNECAEQYDTYGKERKFTTIQGTELTLKCGAYGWKSDTEAEATELYNMIMNGKKGHREPNFISEGWIKGQDDIGDSFVEIDLTNQHLYLWVDGQVELESDIVSGCKNKGNSTPAGVYGITYKTRNAILTGPTWRSFVYYWMPFNRGIGMHDATWRKKFGEDIYIADGSHGCVNLPKANAAKIYEYVSKGFPVVCYYYE